MKKKILAGFMACMLVFAGGVTLFADAIMDNNDVNMQATNGGGNSADSDGSGPGRPIIVDPPRQPQWPPCGPGATPMPTSGGGNSADSDGSGPGRPVDGGPPRQPQWPPCGPGATPMPTSN